MATVKWNSDQTLQLIRNYEQHPQLWDVASVEYRNKEKKTAAVKQIAETLGVSEKEITRKWHNLRCQMNAELRKLQKNRGGSRTHAVKMKSSWEHFDALNFIIFANRFQDSTGASMSGCSAVSSIADEIQKPEVLQSSVKKAKYSKAKRRSFEQIEEERALKKAIDILSTPPDDESIFGEHVAREIRKLKSDKNKNEARRAIAKLLINIGEEDDNETSCLDSSYASWDS